MRALDVLSANSERTAQQIRLREFIQAWRAARTDSASTVDRLRSVIRQIAPYLARHQTTVEVQQPQASVEELAQTLNALKAPLQTARGRGDLSDIWSIAGIGHDEVRNSRVLAWLLNPAGSHGFGEAFIRALWQRIRGFELAGFEMESVLSVTRENYPIASSEHRVDIEIGGADFVVFVEVKVYAGESKVSQVGQYLALARQKAAILHRKNCAVVFLSEMPLSGVEGILPCRWRDVANSIRTVVNNVDRTSVAAHLATQFANHITRFH